MLEIGAFKDRIRICIGDAAVEVPHTEFAGLYVSLHDAHEAARRFASLAQTTAENDILRQAEEIRARREHGPLRAVKASGAS